MGRGSAPAAAIEISNRQYDILDKVQNSNNCGIRQHQRINIILLASQGIANKEVARLLNINLNTVKKWRNRWEIAHPKLQSFEKGLDNIGVKDTVLRKKMLEILKDSPRSGTPARITIAQKEQIVALACEQPEDYGIQKTDWTLKDLQKVVLEKQILPTITSVYIGRLLKNKQAPTS